MSVFPLCMSVHYVSGACGGETPGTGVTTWMPGIKHGLSKRAGSASGHRGLATLAGQQAWMLSPTCPVLGLTTGSHVPVFWGAGDLNSSLPAYTESFTI